MPGFASIALEARCGRLIWGPKENKYILSLKLS
jgi:hypothetical protein